MNLKENILSGFGKQIDIMNTINGGVAMTSFEIEQNKDGYVVNVKNKAINGENFHVELTSGFLNVYATLKSTDMKINNGNNLVVPHFLKQFPIPNEVDVTKIEAVYENGILKIFAPFRADFPGTPQILNIRFN